MCGVDEAGRGPLAGPVCAAAVILPRDLDLEAALPGLNDSKKLTDQKRRELYGRIQDCALAWHMPHHPANPVPNHHLEAVPGDEILQVPAGRRA